MLLSAIGSDMSITQIIIELIMRLPAVILAISFHEAAHGYIAYKCGDPTAKMMGRITMNPGAHFDLLGTVSMLFVGFGWAKPVGINPNNFKNARRDTALVALAGPVSNLIMAVFAMLIYFVVGIVADMFVLSDSAFKIIKIAMEMIQLIALMNVSLMMFNLLPIPPLDGSKVLFSFLPLKAYNFILTYERYGFLILFIVLMTGIIDVPLMRAMNWILSLLYKGCYALFSLIGLL